MIPFSRMKVYFIILICLLLIFLRIGEEKDDVVSSGPIDISYQQILFEKIESHREKLQTLMAKLKAMILAEGIAKLAFTINLKPPNNVKLIGYFKSTGAEISPENESVNGDNVKNIPEHVAAMFDSKLLREEKIELGQNYLISSTICMIMLLHLFVKNNFFVTYSFQDKKNIVNILQRFFNATTNDDIQSIKSSTKSPLFGKLSDKSGQLDKWLKQPEGLFLRPSTDQCVYSILQPNFLRLASYRDISCEGQFSSVSFTRLSEAGFSHQGGGSSVQCQGCSREVPIRDFSRGNYMVDPKHQNFHFTGCQFVDSQGSNDSGFTDFWNIDPSNSHSTTHQTSDELQTTTTLMNDEALATTHQTSGEPQAMTSATASSNTIEGHNELLADNIVEHSNQPILNQEHSAEGRNIAMVCLDHVHNQTPITSNRGLETGHPANTEIKTNQPINSGIETNQPISSGIETNEPINSAIQTSNPVNCELQTISGATAGETNFSGLCGSNFVKSNGKNYPVVENPCDGEGEQIKKDDPKWQEPLHRMECKKNPGHFAYFPLTSLTPEQLPSQCRNTEFLELLKLFGKLTVRVVVNQDSDIRVGTGMVSFITNFEENSEPAEASHGGKGHGVKKFLTNVLKKPKKEKLYIEVNWHVVQTDEEAAKTTVEFFYDQPSRRGVKEMKGKYILRSTKLGENISILVCKTSDSGLVRDINQTKEKIIAAVDKLPRKIKEVLTKKIFIINHPHGKEKVLSYGDSVPVKYEIKTQTNNGNTQYKIEKLNRNQVGQVDVDNARKVLLYAADTCKGSSGAPVISFQYGQPDARGQKNLLLHLWMHNGVDTNYSLSGSVFKTCVISDFQNTSTPNNGESQSATNPGNSDSEDEEGPGQQQVNSPVFKVLSHPSYPAYIVFQKRLDSLNNWQYQTIHTPESLAHAGFFYAGYSDCVRCFQCGLGLKSWKPGDDIYTEHQKYRPECPFLVSQLKAGHGPVAPNSSQTVVSNATQYHNDSKPTGSESLNLADPTTATTPQATSCNSAATTPADVNSRKQSTKDSKLTLLEKENKKLQEQLTCKVCFKAPVQDLFLPCGELYACTECSKLLTHCPSCNKQILATVKTYFS
ncbi:uncharacterized protein LOC131940057 [Physella acuta]|uniref:uncharacterized protein LOC131940057 n=1 Tax=Physella acuta TaxID=109671 RepID=UPI0027DBA79C|nr:uncharacterized protein LOC131940057 [Physella acuta]XP_059154599.1 uncharacterized protein LOC131940057 [Physella acuta]